MDAIFTLTNILQIDIPGPTSGGIDLAFSLGGGAISSFLTTLVIGAILIAVVPDYTQKKMQTVKEEALGSFVYGFASLVFFILVTIVLAITIIGLLVAIPLALVLTLVWAVGAAIGYLMIADEIVGHENGWTAPLLVGAALNGGLTLTGIGGIVSFCVGAAGFGAVLRDYLGD